MVISEKIPLSEAFPWATMRRQAKANLAPPTASFQGKTVLFVGATGVILSDAARIITKLDVSTLILAVRNVAKGEALADELRQKRAGGESPKPTIKVMEVDLLSFDSVRSFAATINQIQTRIDAVVMGSAIMNDETRMTADGWEETLQLIHLSSALLILLLLPKMLADGERQPVVVSSLTSSAIRSAAPMVALPDDAKDSYMEQVSRVEDVAIQKSYQYGIAKIIHASWIRELCNRHLPAVEGRVHFHQLDPGACFTPLSSHVFVGRLLLWFIGRPVEMCARTVVNSCLPVEGSHGRLLVDYDVTPYPEFMDREVGLELQRRTWSETRQILKGLVTPEAELYINS
ncbi:ww domain-containing oxidoreductase [Colletotrichum incanum]|uniref:Ww domain-containing oxidoreductase n=1 Tax=Colletotrichum incanum TaxID=1573173 RepID=A0A167ATM5_COLIC|nr:ww domain-containing oxidoreductase [Colletotrichum incanum]